MEAVDVRALHLIKTVDSMADVRVEANELSHSTIPEFTETRPAPGAILVITPVVITFFGHFREISKQLSSSIILRPYFPEL